MSRGYVCIGLNYPKHQVNVGSALRAAGCYDINFVAITGRRYQKAATDTQKQYRHIPLLHVDDFKNIIPYNCIPIAIEIKENARILPKFTHPERAFYIFGPEDGTLGKDILSWCKHTVYIPTKYCMNLAATVNVVLYDRMAKGLR